MDILSSRKWMDMAKLVIMFAVTDIAFHYQIHQNQQIMEASQILHQQHVCNQTVIEEKYFKDANSSNFSKTAKQLFIAAILRFLFIVMCSQLRVRQAVPKVLKPYIGYIIGCFVYIFFIHAVIRLLVDSEKPNILHQPIYIFLCIFNTAANISACLVSRHVLLVNERVDNAGDQKAQTNMKRNEEIDLDSAERTIPTLTMIRKLAFWYKSQIKWIALGYFCVAVKMVSKYLLHVNCIINKIFTIVTEPANTV